MAHGLSKAFISSSDGPWHRALQLGTAVVWDEVGCSSAMAWCEKSGQWNRALKIFQDWEVRRETEGGSIAGNIMKSRIIEVIN
jgi:hypothetical protein